MGELINNTQNSIMEHFKVIWWLGKAQYLCYVLFCRFCIYIFLSGNYKHSRLQWWQGKWQASVLATATREGCAGKSKLKAFAVARTCLSTSTLCQLLAWFGHCWKIRPVWKPGSVLLVPSGICQNKKASFDWSPAPVWPMYKLWQGHRNYKGFGYSSCQ